MAALSGVLSESCWDFECSLGEDGRPEFKVNFLFMPFLSSIKETAVTQEIQRWPRSPEEAKLGASLADAGFSACVPLKLDGTEIGYMLVENKSTGRSLSSTDLDLLEKVAERFALSVDNLALANELANRLEELQTAYGYLHEAYDFKSEIVRIASH